MCIWSFLWTPVQYKWLRYNYDKMSWPNSLSKYWKRSQQSLWLKKKIPPQKCHFLWGLQLLIWNTLQRLFPSIHNHSKHLGGSKEWCRTNQITINAKSHISTVTWMSRTELTSSHTSRICSIISSENPADRSFPRCETSWLSESLYSFSSFFTFSLWTEKLAALKAFSDCACWCY